MNKWLYTFINQCHYCTVIAQRKLWSLLRTTQLKNSVFAVFVSSDYWWFLTELLLSQVDFKSRMIFCHTIYARTEYLCANLKLKARKWKYKEQSQVDYTEHRNATFFPLNIPENNLSKYSEKKFKLFTEAFLGSVREFNFGELYKVEQVVRWLKVALYQLCILWTWDPGDRHNKCCVKADSELPKSHLWDQRTLTSQTALVTLGWFLHISSRPLQVVGSQMLSKVDSKELEMVFLPIIFKQV